MSVLWRAYLSLLNRRPLSTKCITSGIIMVAGDAIQQGIEHRGRMQQHAVEASSSRRASEAQTAAAAAAAVPVQPAASCDPDSGSCPLPPRRSARSPSAAVSPPPSFLSSYDVARSVRSGIFGALAVGPIFHVWFRTLDRIIPGNTIKPVALKLLLDQGFMAPVFTVFYFCSMGVMEQRPPAEIAQKVSVGLGPTLLANYAIFPLAQGVNFMFVPPQLRVLVLNAGGLLYNVYLSKYNAVASSSVDQGEASDRSEPAHAARPFATAQETAAALNKKQQRAT